MDEQHRRAARLKERVYISFTALAVLIALRTDEVSAGEAALTILITVLGTILAVFVADVVSHIAVHAALPTRAELRWMLRVSFGGLGVVAVPFAMISLAVAGVWTLERALRASTITLVVTLAVIGYLAARRVRLPAWQKLFVLLAEFLLGAAVVGLEWLAHGL